MSTVTKESSLYARVASGGKESIEPCIAMLRSYGYEAPQSRQELAYMLADCAIKHGDKVFTVLAENHPDKDFILDNTVSTQLVLPGMKHNDAGVVYAHRNDCGCSSCSTRNATGNIQDQVMQGQIMPAPGKSSESNLFNNNNDFLHSQAFLLLIALVIMSSAFVFSIIVAKMFSNGK